MLRPARALTATKVSFYRARVARWETGTAIDGEWGFRVADTRKGAAEWLKADAGL